MDINDILLFLNIVLVVVDVYLYKVYVLDVHKHTDKKTRETEDLNRIVEELYGKKNQ